MLTPKHQPKSGRGGPRSVIRRLACAIFAAFLLLPNAVSAQAPPDAAQAAQITADEVTHDRDLNIITARGSVEVAYEQQLLKADSITYDVNGDKINASGNISLLQPDGTVMFAEYMEITGDLKTGIANNIRMLLADKQSRLWALSATRKDGNTTTLQDAGYTPCKPCRDNPEKAPLWQIKAINVIHDQQARRIEYEDAWLEMWGIPVAYTPYLSHPDPTVKRETGLLVPTWGGNQTLGGTLKVPYFWAISPSSDATLTPIVTTKEGVVVAGEYRQMFEKGEMNVDLSGTVDSKSNFRGHFFGKGNVEFSDVWRGDLDIRRSTDDTYLRRYGFGGDTYLQSRGQVEGFSRRSYAAAQFYSFQGQRTTDDPGTMPLILPMLDYNFSSEPSKRGGYWTVDANGLALNRDQGTDSRRLSVKAAWNRPFTSRFGEVYNFSASLRGDGYHVGDHTLDNGDPFDGFIGRVVPQASLDWRFPMVRGAGAGQQILEPIIVGIVSPYGQNPGKIPNEDSRDFEFDDTNLFSANRFTGLDRVEGGPRVNYGLAWRMAGEGGKKADILFGQSYRVHKDNNFAKESGLEGNFSDYVGRVALTPSSTFDMQYRFRFGRSGFTARRNELALRAGPQAVNLGVNYIFVNQNPADDINAEFGDREEISTQLNARLTENWSGQIYTRHDLTQNGGPIRNGVGTTYDDECFTFTADLAKDYTFDSDINSGVSVMFRLVFKTLGEFQTGVQPFN